MKSDIQPPIYWLEKHMNDEAAVQKYLCDFLLTESYSPMVLAVARARWAELPFYVTGSLEPEIKQMIWSKLNDPKTALNRYWICRAVRVLKAYGDCPVPLSQDKRGIGLKRDLLSEKGHKRLCLLEQAVAQDRATNQMGKLARVAAQKAQLDLSLFIGFDYLQPIVHNDEIFFNHLDNATMHVSMSSGCYNKCVHCGYEAVAPVTHMPFPIFLKLFKTVHKKNFYHRPMLYADSDPITYFDPIINADTGDVILALSSVWKDWGRLGFGFTTKGVLTKRDEITFGKIVHNANLHHPDLTHIDWRPTMNMDISLVDLPNEPVAKNLMRVQRTQEIYQTIFPDANVCINHYHLPDQQRLGKQELATLSKVVDVTDLDTVGRFATMAAHLEQNGDYQSKPSTIPFTNNHYVIKSDLVLYDVYRAKNTLVQQSLCSVLNRDFIKCLKNPKRIHPTVVYPKNNLTLKGFLHKLLCGRTHG